MVKRTSKAVVKYKPLSAENDSAFKTERSLDTMTFSGSYLVEITHNGTDVGLPIDDCGEEHYIVGTLVVTDCGTKGSVQNNRVIGQVLTLTSRENKETKVYSRTFADGCWGNWRSLVLRGMSGNIATTDEMVATVEELVAESKSIKTVLSSEITNSQIAYDSIKKNAIQSGSLRIIPVADCVNVTYSDIVSSLVSEVSLPAATTETAGVMNAEDKTTVNSLCTIDYSDNPYRIGIWLEQDGKVVEVSIKIFDEDCFAFQPFYKLQKAAASAWIGKVVEFIHKGEDRCYAENALNEIFPALNVRAFDYNGYYVDEIDNVEDWARVKEEILPFDEADAKIFA